MAEPRRTRPVSWIQAAPREFENSLCQNRLPHRSRLCNALNPLSRAREQAVLGPSTQSPMYEIDLLKDRLRKLI